ncbi:hypothetical protein T484DRAFT_1780836 [Baffinella frigidus]|nr:hypothetical protein T484DRAFT_1780836 [Cryptophyta sp. CCMP2293]
MEPIIVAEIQGTRRLGYETWDEMKPGDLVFAEGTYVKPGTKPQKGDIVHVEAFFEGRRERKTF